MPPKKSGLLRDGRVRGAHARAFIAALAERVGRAVPREELAAEIWAGNRPRCWTKGLTRWARNINQAVDKQLVKRVKVGQAIVAYQVDPQWLSDGLYRLPDYFAIDQATGMRRMLPWRPVEDAFIRKHAGQYTAAQIAELLNAQIGLAHRTSKGVRQRLQQLGVSRALTYWSAVQVAALFGVASNWLPARWIKPGYLHAERRAGGSSDDPKAVSHVYRITDADIEAFIRTQPWHYDHRSMQRGHRLTALAELVYRQDPWLYDSEAARAFGVVKETIRWYRRLGWLPNAQRMRTYNGKPNGFWRTPASDLRALGLRLAQNSNSKRHPSRRKKAAA